jgi:hypothetical protein
MGERRGLYRVSVGRPGRKMLIGRTRCRWKNDIKIKIGHQEMSCRRMDWVDLD